MPIMTRGGAQEASLGLLKLVFRIGGPNRLDRLDRLDSCGGWVVVRQVH